MKSGDTDSQDWVRGAISGFEIVWRRIVAIVVDALLYSIPAYVLHWIVRIELGYSWTDPPTPHHIRGVVFYGSWLVVAIIVETFSLSAFRGTVGKCLTRIAVGRSEAPWRPMPFHRAFVRTFLKMTVFFGFGIGLPRVLQSYVDYLRFSRKTR